MFTLAGGGTEQPREGLPAHRVRLKRAVAAALPGGDVAVLAGPVDSPWLVGNDGRLHALPPLDRVEALAAGADGTLLAVRGKAIRRLRAGSATWERIALPGRKDGRFGTPDSLSGLAVLPGGALAVAWLNGGVWRIGADGRPHRVALPAQTEATALAALPTGELVVSVEDSGADSRLMIAAPGAPLRPLGARFAGHASGLAPLPGGGFARTDFDDLFVHDASGARLARIDARAGLGPGDGGPAAGADLQALGVDAGPDGVVLVEDWPIRSFVSADPGVVDPFMARLFLAMPVRPAIRAFVPPGTARPLAALAPATYRELRDGEVVVHSTLAGRATVVARVAGRAAARASADVAPGTTTLLLDRAVPAGDVSLTLEVQGAAAVAGGALEVSTLRRLDVARARAALRRISTPLYLETQLDPGRCRRASALRFDCALVRASGRCGGRVVVRERPDGRRLTLRPGRRACRTG